MNLVPLPIRRWLSVLIALLLLHSLPAHAVDYSAGTAAFSGNARLESNATDSTSALTWNNASPALTVACWFKISVPSDFLLTEPMAILVNNRTSSASNHAFAIYLGTSGNIEFTARGSGGIDTAKNIIEHPLLDRWYHVAVVRTGSAPLLFFYL